MLVQSFVKNAHAAWPTMAHVEALPEKGELAEVPVLDGVRIDGHGHVHPTEAEHDLRILGTGQIVTTVAPDGRPIGMAREGVRGQTSIAINAGTLTACLTNDRLVGAFLTGMVGGSVALDRRSAWTFSFPWGDVERITLITRAPGGTGEEVVVGLAIQGPLDRPGPGALVIEPGNWFSTEDRTFAPIQDVWTVVDDVTQQVARARGVEVPRYDLDEDGMWEVEFPRDGEAA